METQEEYCAAIATEPPSLEELKGLYREYLQKGLALYKDLALIAQMMGEAHVFPRRAEPWRIYQAGEITVAFGEETTSWHAGRNAWSIRQTLLISIGGPVFEHLRETVVCRMIFQDGQLLIDDDHTVFVPGHWLETLLRDLPAAKKIAGAHASQDYEARRMALAERLLVGKEV